VKQGDGPDQNHLPTEEYVNTMRGIVYRMKNNFSWNAQSTKTLDLVGHTDHHHYNTCNIAILDYENIHFSWKKKSEKSHLSRISTKGKLHVT